MPAFFVSLCPLCLIPSQHVLNIRSVSRIRKDHFLQVRDANARPDRQREEIDNFLGVVPEQVRAEHTLCFFFDQNFEARTTLTDPPRRIPVLRLLEMCAKAQFPRPFIVLQKPYRCYRRDRDSACWHSPPTSRPPL